MIKKYIYVIGLAILSLGVKADEITLICTYDGGAEMMPIQVNFKTNSVKWGYMGSESGWKMVGKLDRYITIRSPDTQISIGGNIMVVDRFSGDFVISYVLYDSTDNNNKLKGMTFKGSCNKKQF